MPVWEEEVPNLPVLKLGVPIKELLAGSTSPDTSIYEQVAILARHHIPCDDELPKDARVIVML